MSDGDTFIQEVSEELRRDRMFALWRRWGPYVIGGVAALVAAAAIAAWLDQREQASMQAAGGALIAAAEAADPAYAYGTLAGSLPDGPALAARLNEGAALAEAGDAAAAAEVYEALAETDGAAPVYRALAAFKAVLLRAPAMSPAERVDALSPHAAEGAPFRPLALEQRAAAHLAAGDRAAAAEDAAAALRDPMATPGLRDRAARLALLAGEDAATVALGGEADADAPEDDRR